MAASVITIDGPGGSGKSTITRLVAARLGLRYLDTGAMYRAATLHCMESNVTLADSRAVAAALSTMKLEVELVPDGPVKVRVNGRDVTPLIRTPEVTRNIRYIADVPAVRDLMVDMQREIGSQGRIVTEGRDQGTVAFPHADLKIFLVASAKVRAERRYNELQRAGIDTSLETVLRDVNQRDHDDKTRPVGPLRKADDAIEVDTSDLSPEQVADRIVELANAR